MRNTDEVFEEWTGPIICPSCGRQTKALGAISGFCRVCELERLIEKAESDMTEALFALSPKDRAIYESSEVLRNSSYEGLGEEGGRPLWRCGLNSEEREAYEVAYATRRYKAIRRRIERARKKIRAA